MNEEHVMEAARALAQGGVVVYPTDTLWGLGAAIGDEAAVRRVFDLKKRPLQQPLSVAVADAEAVADVAIVTPTAKRLFPLLPGPITLVLEKRPNVPGIVTGGRSDVGVRVPAHPDCLALLSRTGPITTTSANVHEAADPRTLADVRSVFGDRVDYYLDSDVAPLGAASTVIDARTTAPRVLRQGAVRESRIRELLLE